MWSFKVVAIIKTIVENNAVKCILKIRSLMVLVFLAISILISQSVNACQVPVFRYALERWASDKYELAIFFNDSLSEDQAALVNSCLLYTSDAADE